MPDLSQITDDFLEKCLGNNEYGDAALFAKMFRTEFVFDTASGKWMRFAGNYWVEDLDEQARACVHYDLAEQYQRLIPVFDVRLQAAGTDSAKKAPIVELIKKNSRRVDRLRSVRGGDNTLRVARSLKMDDIPPMVAHGDMWDSHPLLLPVANGVLDLEVGALRAGDPTDYLRYHSKCEFHLTAKAPVFEQFIREILCEDDEKIAFFQRALGYAITGLTTEPYLFCLTGAGANGKTVLMDILSAVLCDFFWAAETEMFLAQKSSKPSGSASADIASLYGRRLVAMAEAPPHRKIDIARVKKLTGADKLTARAPFDRYEINFRPTAKFFMSFNDRPRGLAVDFAMRRRLIYIDFPLRFVDDVEREQRLDPQNADRYRKRDPDLLKKMLDELPGILSWLFVGCLRYQKYGLKPPESILENVQEIQRDEDQLLRYLEECCERRQGARMLFKTFYMDLAAWWDEEVGDRTTMSRRAVSTELKKRGYQVISTGGSSWLLGLEILIRHDGA